MKTHLSLLTCEGRLIHPVFNICNASLLEPSPRAGRGAAGSAKAPYSSEALPRFSTFLFTATDRLLVSGSARREDKQHEKN
jgi:hypothetical protein